MQGAKNELPTKGGTLLAASLLPLCYARCSFAGRAGADLGERYLKFFEFAQEEAKKFRIDRMTGDAHNEEALIPNKAIEDEMKALHFLRCRADELQKSQ